MALKYWEQRIAALLENSLEEAEAKAVREHCRTCRECGDALTAATRGHELFKGATLTASVDILPKLVPQLQPLPVSPGTRLLPWILLAAAAAVLLAWLVIPVDPGRPNSEKFRPPAATAPDQEPPPTAKPSTPRAGVVGVIARQMEGRESSPENVAAGQMLETSPTEIAHIRLMKAEYIALLPDTRIRPQENGFHLERGNIWCDIPSRQGIPPFRITTSEGEIVVRGTSFGVEASPGTVFVDLVAGLVEIFDPASRSHLLEAGSTATLASGAIAISATPPSRGRRWSAWRLPKPTETPSDTIRIEKPSAGVPASASGFAAPADLLATPPKSGMPSSILGNHRLGH
ncbi:MAG TPA: FecR domain-containing protein [Candidatus Ozemobacteraceae bacterium]|nr:FecR domain-containing protein [Candidatus Ozemobacteraceae bacterium]